MSTEPLKLITAFIHPHLEARVVRAPHDLPEFPGFSLSDTRGQGRGRGVGGTYVATESDLVFQRRLQLQIICPASAVDALSQALIEAAWTGRKGDGVIFVTPVERFARIREAGAPPAQGDGR